MRLVEKDKTENWEISVIEFIDDGKKKFKVTRRLPAMSVAETKIFDSKEEAKKQFEEWLK